MQFGELMFQGLEFQLWISSVFLRIAQGFKIGGLQEMIRDGLFKDYLAYDIRTSGLDTAAR